ncbi:hypothetical protein FQR65_LT15650 [Abscondita terminalis]|nr:hypothetical protein FQR65_LT15650 [Abscondita terminalis]
MTVIRFATVHAFLKFENYFRRYSINWYAPNANEPPLLQTNRFLFALLNAGTVTNMVPLTQHHYDHFLVLRGNRYNYFSWADNVSQLASQIAIGRPIATYSKQMYPTWTAHSRSLDDSKVVFISHDQNHFEAMLPTSINFEFVKPEAHNLMMDSHAAVVDNNEKPVKKYLMLRFVQNLTEHKIEYVKTSISEASLMSKLNTLLIRDNKETVHSRNVKWNAESERILLECGLEENSIEDVTEPSKFIPQQNNSQKRVCIDQGLKMDDRGNTWKKMKTSNLKLPLSSALTSANSSSNSKGDETNNENELPSLPKNRRRPTTRITTLTSSDVAHKYNIILDRRLVLLEKQRLQIEEQVAYDREERKLKLEQLKLDVAYKKELLKQNFNLHLEDGDCWYYALSVTFGNYFRRYSISWYAPNANEPPLLQTNRFLFALLNAGTVSNMVPLTQHYKSPCNVDYIESNPELTYVTTASREENRQREIKWTHITQSLNEMDGPKRTVKQWQSAFADLKTNVRRKARAVRAQQEGTGGGPATSKPLTDLEERVLALLNRIIIDGAPMVIEPGMGDLPVINIANVEIPNNENMATPIVIIAQEDIIEAGTAPPAQQQYANAPLPPQRRRRVLQRPTPLVGFENLVQSNNNIAKALNNIAKAILQSGRKQFVTKNVHRRN